ncbi:MAG: ATP-binding protein, partial [Marinirhabdus sp.]|nr:ATP-binding protein [Marinirhabdus sp.]
VLETGKPIEKRVVSKKGVHFLKRITPFESQESNTEGVVITFININKVIESQNELKKSEQKFKDFYDSDPIMHVSVNPTSGKIVECNQMFLDTLGYKAKNEVVGRSVYSFYTKKSKIKASKLLEKILTSGDIENEEMTIISKDGQRIPVLLNSNLKVDANGVHYTRSTLVDISKQKEMRKTVLAQKAELERANKELEQFVSICSHDLQEPLSTIKFGSDLLRKKFNTQLDEKGNEYVNHIYESSGRLSNQIKALLEHTRIGQDLVKEAVDTRELVDVVLYDLGKRISESDAEIKVGKLPTIEGYKTELRLLFQNLIGNAIKYCREDVPPKIRINAFEDGDHYIFSVKDNGIGIKEEDLGGVFTIFNRVPTEKKYEGTGVGLAHCEKIIKLHGGNIWVDSEYGEGSTFYFKLEKE